MDSTTLQCLVACTSAWHTKQKFPPFRCFSVVGWWCCFFFIVISVACKFVFSFLAVCNELSNSLMRRDEFKRALLISTKTVLYVCSIYKICNGQIRIEWKYNKNIIKILHTQKLLTSFSVLSNADEGILRSSMPCACRIFIFFGGETFSLLSSIKMAVAAAAASTFLSRLNWMTVQRSHVRGHKGHIGELTCRMFAY